MASARPITILKLYGTCPSCGRRLCRVMPGSEVETECPKCQNTVLILADKAGVVSTSIIATTKAAQV